MKSLKTLTLKEWAILVSGFLLYLNYRMIYAFFIHKPVQNFEQFATSKSTTEVTIVFVNDLFLISWYFFGFWYSILFSLSIIILNYTVYFIRLVIKKYKK